MVPLRPDFEVLTYGLSAAVSICVREGDEAAIAAGELSGFEHNTPP